MKCKELITMNLPNITFRNNNTCSTCRFRITEIGRHLQPPDTCSGLLIHKKMCLRPENVSNGYKSLSYHVFEAGKEMEKGKEGRGTGKRPKKREKTNTPFTK